MTAVSSSRRRCAPRSLRCSPRSPWPAAPATGVASARRDSTPCVAGVGFAVHRLAHRAVQSRPHKCGQRRRRYRRRAAHDPVQHPLHSRPLKRRSGSPPPGSPASIPQTSMLPIRPSRPPGAALGLTPHASLMQACHRGPWRALAGPFGATRGHTVVGTSEFRAQLADRHRHGLAWPRVGPRATRAQLIGFRIVFREFRVKLARNSHEFRPRGSNPPHRDGDCAQSGASPPSDSWNARASPTSFSISASRPSRSIASRFSVARNHV